MDVNLMVILTATLAVTSGIIGSFSEFTFYKNTMER